MRPAELDDLEIDVSVLYPPEPIDSPEQLDVKQYGVIVERGHRRGLLLPDIPGIDDVATQVRYALDEGGDRGGGEGGVVSVQGEKYT